MAAALACLVLLAPAAKKHWSKEHDVGLWVPKSYRVVAQDRGQRVLVAEGPRLGAGIPRLALSYAGPAGREGLDRVADRLVARVKSRPGWVVVARTRKRIGGVFPAVRFGLRFSEGGGEGRGRFTVALLGGSYFVLELSAHASRFPGAVFDRIEQSLEVKWTEHRLEGGLVVRIPAGWAREEQDEGPVFLGPRLGIQASLVRFWRDEGLHGPKTAQAGPKLRFLGRKRETLQDERSGPGALEARMRIVHAEGWTALFILPVRTWDDLAPTAEEIVRTARLVTEDEKK